LFGPPGGLVYTRRIGRAPEIPTLRTDEPRAERLYDLPELSTLLGAAKLTGTIGKRVQAGVLAALTGRNTVRVQVDDATPVRRVLDPLTFYGVFRLKANLAHNLDVGLIGTTVDRFEPTGLSAGWAPNGQAICPDGTSITAGARCFHDAHVGGRDFRWRSPGVQWTTSGLLAVSGITGGPPRTMLDGTVIRSGDAGAGAIVAVAE